MNATLKSLIEAAKGTDSWMKGYAIETLKLRAAESKDRNERRLAALALRKLGA